jgi:predicted RNA-binding protein with TRAM domain
MEEMPSEKPAEFGERRFQKPVKEGETYTVKIEGKGEKGDGIAKVEGFIVFVPGTEPGQEVKIRITRVLRKFAFGEVAP